VGNARIAIVTIFLGNWREIRYLYTSFVSVYMGLGGISKENVKK